MVGGRSAGARRRRAAAPCPRILDLIPTADLKAIRPAFEQRENRRDFPSYRQTDVDQRTDEQLVEAYREGEVAALEALVRRYQAELLGFLTRQLGNRAAAEDVFQETFLQVHQSVEHFDVSRRFRPWIFTIAANKGRDWYRKNSRRMSMVDLSAPVRPEGMSENSAHGGANVIDFLADDGEPVDARLDEAELRELVRTTIDSMPFLLREILQLAYFQRLSYQDIADSLGIPLGTVKSRLHSAVANFAERWKRAGGGGLPVGQKSAPSTNRDRRTTEMEQRP